MIGLAWPLPSAGAFRLKHSAGVCVTSKSHRKPTRQEPSSWSSQAEVAHGFCASGCFNRQAGVTVSLKLD